jgi:CheY-like chemotaxis protein
VNRQTSDDSIRILIADDDEHVLECYRDAFGESAASDHTKALNALDAELFDTNTELESAPKFELVACNQGQDAIDAATAAANDGNPFDVVILDVRMPPGIDGVEAGSQIRALDPEIEIVFVTGFSDIPLDELERRVPPPMRLHYFNKPLSFMKLAEDVAGMIAAH